jgi:hypothetical protein
MGALVVVALATTSCGAGSTAGSASSAAETDVPSDPQGEPPPESEASPDLVQIRAMEEAMRMEETRQAAIRAAQLETMRQQQEADRRERARQYRVRNGPDDGTICRGVPGVWYQVQFDGDYARVWYLTTPNSTFMSRLSNRRRDGNQWVYTQASYDIPAYGAQYPGVVVQYFDGERVGVAQNGRWLAQDIACR